MWVRIYMPLQININKTYNYNFEGKVKWLVTSNIIDDFSQSTYM